MSLGTSLRTYQRGHTLASVREQPVGGPAATRYYHADHQGTTQALTDSTGAVTDRFASDAWGVQVKRTGSSINRQWYVGNLGHYRAVDQLLDYVRARYLAVVRGRWLAVDPIRSQTDRFRYAANGPSARVDASGLDPCTVSKFTSTWIS